MKTTEKIINVMVFVAVFAVIFVNAWFYAADFYELVALYRVSVGTTIFTFGFLLVWLYHIILEQDED